MTAIRGPWDQTELSAFLSEATIPIRIATQRPDDTLWIVTLWFRYSNGELLCATEASADIVRFLTDNPSVAFDISTNQPPYRGVRGTGTVSLSADPDKETLRLLIRRYLGTSDSPLAKWLLNDKRNEIRIRIVPTDLYTWDYRERMQQTEKSA